MARSSFFSTASALTFVFLSACASASPVPTAPLSAPATTTAITLWHTETDVATAMLATLADDFHKTYPNITVRAQAKPSEGDLLREALGALALNQTPDLALADPRTLAEFARRGALVNLDALASDAKQGLTDADRADFIPGLLDAGRMPDLKNQWLGFPFDTSAVVLYYNADLLQAAKQIVPRTWDQFGEAARATTRNNVRGWVMSPSAPVFAAFLCSRGSSVLNATQTQAQFGDGAGLAALQLIVALNKGGAAYLADNANSARNDFAQAKTAFLFDTTDALTPITDAINRAGNFKWGIANIPQSDPAQTSTIVLGKQIAIFKPVGTASDDRTRAAWLFARWLTLMEQSARWAQATFSLPIRLSTQTLLASSRLPPNLQRLRDGFGDVLPTVKAMPAVKDAGLIDSALVEMWINVANGADPATTLKNATMRANRVLGQIP